MDVRTYRSKTLQGALAMVREDLGSDAAILRTRELPRGGLRRWLGRPRFEVSASVDVQVPSRIHASNSTREEAAAHPVAAVVDEIYHRRYDDLRNQLAELHSLVADLCERGGSNRPSRGMPESLFQVFNDLLEADVRDDIARELIDRVRSASVINATSDSGLIKREILGQLSSEIRIGGPIAVTPNSRRIVALAGPTGVGKTTTIAKLAANFRLRERRRVGLITVDTYRIAAVEQLRVYADIIDLPMEVVSTPRQMREAVNSMRNMELILIDTSGRSPQDAIKIRELRSMLSEGMADEVHLVLSSIASDDSLIKTVEKFRPAGVTSLILTKLDEAWCLGNILPLLRQSRLPLSYITNGQNVPDDIETADSKKLAGRIIGIPFQAGEASGNVHPHLNHTSAIHERDT